MIQMGDLVSGAMRWIKSVFSRFVSWISRTSRHIFVKPHPGHSDESDAEEILPVIPRASHKSPAKPRYRPIRRRSRERVYRLKGYTTVAKVNRRRQSERQQLFLRRIMVAIIIILLVILLYNIYNPFKDLGEWSRIIGIKSIADLAKDNPLVSQTTTTRSTTTQTTTTATTEPSS